MSVELIIAQGSNRGTAAAIHPGYYLVGRHKECQIRPKSRSVSRRHCLLLRNEDGFGALDLKSTRGTYVNGQRIESHQWRVLKDADEIRFGKVAFTVSIKEPALTASAESLGGQPTTGHHETESVSDKQDLKAPESWHSDEVAEFLEEEDTVEMQRRYADIRRKSESEKPKSSPTSDGQSLDDDLSVFDDTPIEVDKANETFIGDLPDEPDAHEHESRAVEVDSKPRKKPPRRPIDPKTYKRAQKRSISLPSVSVSLNWKSIGAIALVVAALGLFGYQLYRFQAGPQIDVRENLD